MILLKRGTTAEIVVTLTETTTIEAPFYLFRFIHQLTKKELTIILEDLSATAERVRFNLFSLDVDEAFTGFDDGIYYYKVYEQASSINIDFSLAGKIVETGIAKLINEAEPVTVEYEPTDNEFITYEGR